MSLTRGTTDDLIETVDGVSLAGTAGSAEGAGVKSMPVSPNGPSSALLEVAAAPWAEKVRDHGLRLVGCDRGARRISCSR